MRLRKHTLGLTELRAQSIEVLMAWSGRMPPKRLYYVWHNERVVYRVCYGIEAQEFEHLNDAIARYNEL